MNKKDTQIQGFHTVIRLNEIFAHLSSSLDDMLAVAVVEISKLFSTDLCCILIPQGSSDELKIAAQEPQTQIYPHLINSNESCVLSKAVKSGNLVMSNEASECPMRIQETPPPSLCICLPLYANNKVSAVLFLQYMSKNDMSNNEVNLLIAIGNLISSNIHRAELYNNLIHEKEQIESANKKIRHLNFELEQRYLELQNTQEQLVQAQKLEAMGRLAGGIAHDFNNILVVILGYSELLLSTFKEQGSAKKHLERIIDAVNRATALTRQILAFSRKQVIDLQVVSINDIVANNMNIVKTMLPENLEIAVSLYPGLSNVEADSHKIEQVLMNLIINARDAMPAGGRLVIKTFETNIDDVRARNLHLKNGRYVVISVCDTGTGIMDDVVPHIFEPFFTTKEKDKGTGLGLSVAYGIIKQHNGTIQVETRVGKGSTFYVYLPVTEKGKEKEISKPLAKEYNTFSGKEKILVVEDNEAVLILVSDTLTSLGYSITTASNGYEAIRLAESSEEPFALLVTDVVMPRMNGRELFERLSTRLPSLKVLYISGYSHEVLHKSGVKNQDVVLLEKPFDKQRLAKTIRQVLDSSPQE